MPIPGSWSQTQFSDPDRTNLGSGEVPPPSPPPLQFGRLGRPSHPNCRERLSISAIWTTWTSKSSKLQRSRAVLCNLDDLDVQVVQIAEGGGKGGGPPPTLNWFYLGLKIGSETTTQGLASEGNWGRRHDLGMDVRKQLGSKIRPGNPIGFKLVPDRSTRVGKLVGPKINWF